MNSSRRRQLLLVLITIVTLGSTALVAAAGSQAHERLPEAWVGTWAAAPAQAPPAGPDIDEVTAKGFKNQTIRTLVRTSVGGTQGRVRLTNRFGKKPLVVGHATLALPRPDAGPGDLRGDTVREATFNGQKSVTIPPGGTVLTDPVVLDVPWAQDVAISIFLPEPTGPPTLHYFSRTTSFIGPGDNAADASGAKLSKTIRTWYFISGLDVLNRTGEGAIAILGDSISDAIATTPNANRRWTNHLAARLNTSAPDGRAPGILNVSLAGNRLGADGAEIKLPHLGVNASARFHEDVLGQTGVRAVILELGINDVWLSHDDANTIISRMRQIASQAHQSGLEIFACTLTPWDAYATPDGTVQYTPALDSIRLTVNSYLRTTGDFDGIIDFDLVLRDPASPTKLRAGWDSGDHIHPNDAGNEAMAAAVSVDMLLDD